MAAFARQQDGEIVVFGGTEVENFPATSHYGWWGVSHYGRSDRVSHCDRWQAVVVAVAGRSIWSESLWQRGSHCGGGAVTVAAGQSLWRRGSHCGDGAMMGGAVIVIGGSLYPESL
ncbi:unnamed protein product [Cuscuta epithymum]|uniref:Uncharacterized protein n=1 Tax=Cuscuta epithymum TaxID=186058 RepID=A0AAV0D9Y8_9ASTE|nr:unnamed protein product [Cuscuta epithymum]